MLATVSTTTRVRNKIVRRSSSITGELMTLPRSCQAVVLIAIAEHSCSQHDWRLCRVPETNSFRDVTERQMAVNADWSTESQLWPGPSDDELLAFLPLHATFL